MRRGDGKEDKEEEKKGEGGERSWGKGWLMEK